MQHKCILRSQRLTNLLIDLALLFDPTRPVSEQWEHITDDSLPNANSLPETTDENHNFTLSVTDVKTDNHAVRSSEDETTVCGTDAAGLIIVILDENPKELVDCTLCISILEIVE